ncbi:MAG: endonuclease/exonuclease/phosphatase family protein [Planctomycetota bacterium]
MESDRRPARWRFVLHRGQDASLLLFAVALSAPVFFLGEILTNLGHYLAWFGLVVSISAWVDRRFAIAALLMILGIWFGAASWSLSLRARSAIPATSTSAQAFRVATMNLLFDNDDQQGVRELIERERPDVIFCCEVSTSWRDFLLELQRYPYRHWSPALADWVEPFPIREHPKQATWGTVILSTKPFLETGLLATPGDAWRPTPYASIEVGSEAVRVFGAHTMRPGKAWRLRLRNLVLDQIAAEATRPTDVLVGDLNTTAASRHFGRLLSSSGLRDSREGFGRQPTFSLPSWLPLFSVTLDHVLVGSRIGVADRRVVEVPGSDHLGVVADLVVLP